MADYTIAKGTPDWDVPLNSNMSNIDARITAITSQTSTQFNVKSYGAVGDGIADDTLAIQAAMDAAHAAGGGVVYLPTGTYKISASITIYNRLTIRGDGDFVTNIVQSNSGADGFVGASLIYIIIEHLRLTGPNTGGGRGLHFTVEFDYCILRDISTTGWGLTGIDIEQPIVSNFTRVTSFSNGGAGFYIHGTGLGAGTSCSFDSCWAHDNVSNGFSFFNMTYCALMACAADNQTNASRAGYLIDTCTGFSLLGCGSEVNNYGIKFSGGTGHFVSSFFGYATPASGIGIYVAGTTNVNLLSIVESNANAGAAAWVQVDSGSSCTIQGSVATTANVLSSGTTVVAANASGVRSYPNGLSTSTFTATGATSLQGAALNAQKITGLANGTVSTDAAAFGQIPVAGATAGTFTAGNDGRLLQAFNGQPKLNNYVTWNHDPLLIQGTAGTNTSGTIYLHKVYLGPGQTATGVALNVQTAGATLTSGQNLLGLYDATGARVATTADQSTAWTTTGYKQASFTVAHTPSTGGFYYVAVLAVGTTAPAFSQQANASQTIYNANTSAGTFKHCADGAGQTSLPSSITLGSTTSTAVNTWVAIF